MSKDKCVDPVNINQLHVDPQYQSTASGPTIEIVCSPSNDPCGILI